MTHLADTVFDLAVALRNETGANSPLEDRLDDLGLVENLGAGGFRVVKDDLIEVLARLDQPVVGPVLEFRKRSSRPTRGVYPQALDPLPGCQLFAETHLVETLTARGVSPSPHVFSREIFLLANEHGVAAGRQEMCGGGAGRSSSDDRDVDLGRHCASLSATPSTSGASRA